LPVNGAVIEALGTIRSEAWITLPNDREVQDDVGTALGAILGTEDVYLVGLGGDGILIVRRDDVGYRAATVDAEPAEFGALVPQMLIAIERGEPLGEIAVDTGNGWRRSESRSYIAEYIIMGTGGATVIVGGVMLALAASQADVVRECQVPGECSEEVARDNGELYAANLFTGQLLMGIGG